MAYNPAERGAQIGGGQVISLPPSGDIDVGDLIYARGGNAVRTATNAGSVTLRHSAVGVAIESSPREDSFGIERAPATINIMREGSIEVDAYSDTVVVPIGTWALPTAVGNNAYPQTGGRGTPPKWSAVPIHTSGLYQVIGSRAGKMTLHVSVP